MTPQPDDEPYELTYRSITDKNDRGQETYSGDLTNGLTIMVGDQFWDTVHQHLLCVRDVVTRVRLDNDGKVMSSGPKYVKVESDHPKHLEGSNDGTFVLNLEGFCVKVGDQYVPHDANGYEPQGVRK
jgi:hypothetical protein